jgi:hypothetical protein
MGMITKELRPYSDFTVPKRIKRGGAVFKDCPLYLYVLMLWHFPYFIKLVYSLYSPIH